MEGFSRDNYNANLVEWRSGCIAALAKWARLSRAFVTWAISWESETTVRGRHLEDANTMIISYGMKMSAAEVRNTTPPVSGAEVLARMESLSNKTLADEFANMLVGFINTTGVLENKASVDDSGGGGGGGGIVLYAAVGGGVVVLIAALSVVVWRRRQKSGRRSIMLNTNRHVKNIQLESLHLNRNDVSVRTFAGTGSLKDLVAANESAGSTTLEGNDVIY